jgi:hypothetical protein
MIIHKKEGYAKCRAESLSKNIEKQNVIKK